MIEKQLVMTKTKLVSCPTWLGNKSVWVLLLPNPVMYCGSIESEKLAYNFEYAEVKVKPSGNC